MNESPGLPDGPRPSGEAAGTLWPRRGFLASLPEHMRTVVIARGRRRVFSPGQVFITQGDEARNVYVLLDGVARVELIDDSGDPRLIDIQVKGDTVGEMAALEDEPRSATVRAAGEVVATDIAAQDFHELMTTEPAVSFGIARMLSLRERSRMRQMLDFNQYDARIRLARLLVALSQKCGIKVADGISLGEVVSQSDLAPLAGTSDPSIHRALAFLRQRSAVTTGRRRLIVTDIDCLQKLGNLDSD